MMQIGSIDSKKYAWYKTDGKKSQGPSKSLRLNVEDMEDLLNAFIESTATDVAVEPSNGVGGYFHNFRVELDTKKTPQEQFGDGTVAPHMLHVGKGNGGGESGSESHAETGYVVSGSLDGRHSVKLNSNTVDHVGMGDGGGEMHRANENTIMTCEDTKTLAPALSSETEYIGPGDLDGPHARDGESAVLFLVALQRKYTKVETVLWSYFTTSSGVLWMEWNLRVEVDEKHHFQAEIEKMKDCVGQMYKRRVVLLVMFVDAPRGVSGYQGTGSVYHSGGGGPETLIGWEYNNNERHNTIFGTTVGTGIGKDMEPDVTRRGDLFLAALRARFERVRTVWWNFEASYEGQLSLQWRIVVQLNEGQNMLEEMRSMEACVEVLWYRRVGVMMVFIDAPRGPTKYQETRTLCE
ncbi:hypothetical protein GG344DRAFT_75267 [Lentinula edodes]|nr:hypothetical protein GG344DRAFT_75267 [Lentinula edodes]